MLPLSQFDGLGGCPVMFLEGIQQWLRGNRHRTRGRNAMHIPVQPSIYSPFFSENLKRVLAMALLVMVLALPPLSELASEADICIETGQRADASAKGSTSAAERISSFTYGGNFRSPLSGIWSMKA